MSMKKILSIVVTLLFLWNCSSDPCEDITCLNNGVCVDGICDCADWYEGLNCETERREKYFGDYFGIMTRFEQGGTYTDTATTNVSTDSKGVNFLLFDNLLSIELIKEMQIELDGRAEFNIPLVLITDPDNGDSNYFTGSGLFVGTSTIELTVIVTNIDGTPAWTLSFEGSR